MRGLWVGIFVDCGVELSFEMQIENIADASGAEDIAKCLLKGRTRAMTSLRGALARTRIRG